MAVSLTGLRWPDWPLRGAVGAGRHDEAPPVPDSYTLTPSGQAEQDSAYPEAEEVPGEGPE